MPKKEDIKWFAQSDPSKDCSLCSQPIEGPVSRIIQMSSGLEARFHPAPCFEQVKDLGLGE